LIKDLASSLGNLRNLIENIRKKGREEGFGDFEITLLARKILNRSLTRRQLNYWFSTRTNAKKMKHAQNVHNDEKKGTVQFPVPFVAPTLNQNVVSVPSIKTRSEAQDSTNGEEMQMNQSKARTPRSITYSDLVDAKSVDSTIYPLHQQLKKPLLLKDLSPSAKYNLSSSNLFQVSKDCDFINEHFKARIEPKQAIEYLQQYVGRCRKIDFAFRVIE
jgi:hypothetical protein